MSERLESRFLLTANPSVNTVMPASGSTAVALNVAVTATVNLPNGGIDPNTVVASNLYLYQTAYPNNPTKVVPASIKTTGGGDSLLLTPLSDLMPSTSYTFVVSAGIKDINGDAFTPYTESFTTGNTVPAVSQNYAFAQVQLPATQGYAITDMQVGPDGKMYASTETGQILRFAINSDGTLGTPKVITSLQTAEGGKRLISGFAFDPSFIANPSNPMLWVNNSYFALSGATNAPNFTSKLTVMSGSDLQTVTDAIISLPRSVADHINDQPVFQPGTKNLFFCQASENAYGAPDSIWGNRSETLLSAAILEVDTSALNLSGPAVNVLTSDVGGTYDPYASGAPLTIYATGVRNAFPLLFDDKGQLWAPLNGSNGGGNSPAGPGDSPPALTDIQQNEDDTLLKIQKGGYYGHPDPVRNQFVLNQGNPSSGAVPGLAMTAYPVGTNPDPNYQLPNYVFPLFASPDSIIEYHGSAFGGKLAGKFLVTEYSAPDDIVVLSRDSNNNIIGGLLDPSGSSKPDYSVAGLQHLNSPLAVAEDPSTGYLYVSVLGPDNVILLKPASVTQKITASLPRVVFNTIATGNAGAGPSRTQDLTITNAGADSLNLSSIGIVNAPNVSPAASDFTILNASSEPMALSSIGASFTFQLQFNASIVGLETAILQIKSNDPVNPTLSIYLHGIGTPGLYGSNEPSLVQVLQANGIPTIVGAGPNDVNINTVAYPDNPDPSSQEVTMQEMMAATPGPVTITPIASFSTNSQPVSEIGYYTPGNASATTELFSIAQSDAQTVTPTPVGTTSFDPGSNPFGLYAYFPGVTTPGNAPDFHYSQDALNAMLDPANPRKIRFFPYETPTGTIVPNSYVVAVEDYNDTTYNSFDNFVGIISNVTGGTVTPGSFAAASNTNSGVVLSWTAAIGATSYTILREDPGSSTFTPIATGLTAPTFTDANVAAGETYQYEVQAVNALNSSAPTAPVSANLPVVAPTNLQASRSTAGVVLTWTAAIGATSYTILREDPGSSTFTPIATGLTAPTYTDSNVAAGEAYQYEVQSDNAQNSSAPTAPVSANLPVVAPTNLQANSSTASVALTWTASTGATSYSVQRQGPGESTFSQIATGLTATTYTDTSVQVGKTYQYEVLASNGSNSSPATAPVTAVAGATVAVTVGKGANKSVRFVNDAGTLTTIKLSGPGTATVNFIGLTLSQATTASGVVLSGSGITITGISVAGAPGSALSIATHGGANAINIAGIAITGALGKISAPTATLIGTLTATGSVRNIRFASATGAVVTINGNLGVFQTGAVSDTAIDTTGNIGSINAAALINSQIYAGTSLDALGPFPPVIGAFPASIGSIVLRKIRGMANDVNSSIAAHALNHVALGSVQFNNNGVAFGVEASLIKSLSFADSTVGKNQAFTRLTSAAVVAADLAKKGINPRDFEIDII